MAQVVTNLSTIVDKSLLLPQADNKSQPRLTFSQKQKHKRDLLHRLKQSQAYRLMDSAKVLDNLQSSTIVELLPTNESQARPHIALLARLK